MNALASQITTLETLNTSLTLAASVAALLLVATTVAAALWRIAHRSRVPEGARLSDEQLLRQVREKARQARASAEETQLVSGEESKTALLAIINGLIRKGYYDEGIKWALHAHAALPQHPEFGFKLAELYYRSGDAGHFIMVARELHTALRGPHRRHWRAVAGMGRVVAPGNAMFTGGTGAAGRMRPSRVPGLGGRV